MTEEQTSTEPVTETPVTPETPPPAVETGAAVVTAVAEAPDGAGAKYGYYWGTGRRKTAVARVRVRPGEGKYMINKRPREDFFKLPDHLEAVVAPLKVTDSGSRVDVFVNVKGGGPSGQAGAIVLGLARALRIMNPDYDQPLREANYLTRDPRKVERKKYGQRGARRRFQFSKR